MPDSNRYTQAGVDYGSIDPFKVRAQKAAATTADQLSRRGFKEVTASRGESAYVVDVGPFYLASIVECLGTKALVADEMARLTDRIYFESIAQDTIAMAVNDLITVGATPLVIQAYWAAGDSDWFKDLDRGKALVAGWLKACESCGAAWGGGETPALAGVVESGRIDLAASCTGVVNPKERLIDGSRLGAGDTIVLLHSSGIHANGLSLARKIAGRLPNGYLTKIGDGRTYGEALLDPTVLYAPVMEGLRLHNIVPTYCANITGHGWMKLMRHPGRFAYNIHTIPPVPPVLEFIQNEDGLNNHEAYSTFNMGAGFAVFVPPLQALQVVDIARWYGVDATVAGSVSDDKKQVYIDPVGVLYGEDELNLRA